MDSTAVIFPHQLFRNNPCFKRDRITYLMEDPWFFRDPENLLKFHQQKLVLHRASMQAYRDFFRSRGYLVRYLEFTQEMDMGYLFDLFRQDGISEIVTCEPVERGLKERLIRRAEAWRMKVNVLTPPMFLCSEGDIGDFFPGRQKFHQTSSYIFQRRRWDILLENGKHLDVRPPD